MEKVRGIQTPGFTVPRLQLQPTDSFNDLWGSDQSAILSCFFPLPPSLSYSFLPRSSPVLPPSLLPSFSPFHSFFTSTNIHPHYQLAAFGHLLSKLLSTTLLDFCDPLLQTQIGSCCPCTGQGRKLLAPQGEASCCFHKKENGMLKRQNNEGPVYIHLAITYLLEVCQALF